MVYCNVRCSFLPTTPTSLTTLTPPPQYIMVPPPPTQFLVARTIPIRFYYMYVHTQTQPAVVASAYSLAPKLQFIHPAGFLTAWVTLGRYLSVCLAAAPSLSGVGISRIVISMLEEKIYRLVLLHGLSLNTAETNKCLCKSGLSYLK